MLTNITLRQALNNFHQENYKTISESDSSTNSEGFYNNHDIAHVVFGCDTSVLGEGVVKLWTIFGTTLGFLSHIREYSEVNAFDVAQQYTMKQILLGVIQLLFLAPVVVIRAQRMKKKWPWSSFDYYIDIPLIEIRSEFNITPILT